MHGQQHINICLVSPFHYYVRHILCQTSMTRCHTHYKLLCNS